MISLWDANLFICRNTRGDFECLANSDNHTSGKRDCLRTSKTKLMQLEKKQTILGTVKSFVITTHISFYITSEALRLFRGHKSNIQIILYMQGNENIWWYINKGGGNDYRHSSVLSFEPSLLHAGSLFFFNNVLFVKILWLSTIKYDCFQKMYTFEWNVKNNT